MSGALQRSEVPGDTDGEHDSVQPEPSFPPRVQTAIDLLAEVRARRIREGRTQDVGRDALSADKQ